MNAHEVREKLITMYHSVVTPTFGDIRATVQQTASVEAWFKLCKLIEKWPQQDRLEAEVIPYVQAHTVDWPDRMRVVPDRWLEAWLDESLGPIASLMRRMFLGSKLRKGVTLDRFLEVSNNRHLTQLDLGWNQLNQDDFRILARADYLENLTHLGLRGNHPRDAGVHLLSEAEWFERIEWLDLSTCAVTSDGARALAESNLSRIEHLDVSRNKLGASGLRTLLNANWMPRVRTLMLQGNNLFVSGMTEIAESYERLASLRHLHLGDNGLQDEGVRALLQTPLLVDIEELELSSNQIGDEGVILLVSSPYIRSLTHLNLLGNQIQYDGLRAIANSKNLSNLRDLDLPRVDADSSQLIVDSPVLHQDIRARWK